jgi:hypothetical protein
VIFVIAPFLAFALGTPPQQDAPSPAPPSAIEQAIVEYRCSASRAPGESDQVRQVCLEAQLTLLRASFGPDLSQLSAADRKTLDSTCETVRARGRDPYVACLSDQLAALSARRGGGNRSSDPLPGEPSMVATPADVVLPPAAPVAGSSSTALWVAFTLGTLAIAGGGTLLWRKGRSPAAPCRSCGRPLPTRGDLCESCRHEAADRLRRAAAARADAERVREDEERQAREVEEARLQDRKRQVGEDHLKRRELAEREQQDRTLRGRTDESPSRDDAPSADVPFDPHVVLGIALDASRGDIETAYEAARARYAPEHVAHLGIELQEHYRTRADAVERAYRMLLGENEAG